MATMAERIVARLDALERQMTDVALQAGTGTSGSLDGDTPIAPQHSNRVLSESLNQLRQEVEQMRAQIGGTEQPSRGPPMNGMSSRMMSPKELLPDVLSGDYKTKWRAWSYKACDYLSLWHETLGPKLEAVECIGTELSND